MLLILLLTFEVQGCVDNMLWRDIYGWSCRDYDRDPLECSSTLAISDVGMDAYEACCSCRERVEMRRDYASCLSTCSAEEDACEAECTADKADCVDECTEEWMDESEDYEEDVGGAVGPSADYDDDDDDGGSVSSSSSAIPTWVIILIVLGILLVLCIICLLLFFLCMPGSEGSCEDACQDDDVNPMLLDQGCDTCPNPSTYDVPQGQMYAPPCGPGVQQQGFQQQTWQ